MRKVLKTVYKANEIQNKDATEKTVIEANLDLNANWIFKSKKRDRYFDYLKWEIY